MKNEVKKKKNRTKTRSTDHKKKKYEIEGYSFNIIQ